MKDYDDINNFVINFISNCDQDKLISTWKSRSVQQMFRNVVIPTKKQRHKSGYQLFCEDYRPVFMKDNVTFPMKEINKLLASKWQDMKVNFPDEVKTYEQRSQTAREELEKENVSVMMSALAGSGTSPITTIESDTPPEICDTDSKICYPPVRVPDPERPPKIKVHSPKIAPSTPNHRTPSGQRTPAFMPSTPTRPRRNPAVERIRGKEIDYASSDEDSVMLEMDPQRDPRYRRYIKHKLIKLQRHYSDMSVQDLTYFIRKKWDKMKDEDKQKY